MTTTDDIFTLCLHDHTRTEGGYVVCTDCGLTIDKDIRCVEQMRDREDKLIKRSPENAFQVGAGSVCHKINGRTYYTQKWKHAVLSKTKRICQYMELSEGVSRLIALTVRKHFIISGKKPVLGIDNIDLIASAIYVHADRPMINVIKVIQLFGHKVKRRDISLCMRALGLKKNRKKIPVITHIALCVERIKNDRDLMERFRKKIKLTNTQLNSFKSRFNEILSEIIRYYLKGIEFSHCNDAFVIAVGFVFHALYYAEKECFGSKFFRGIIPEYFNIDWMRIDWINRKINRCKNGMIQ